MNGMNKQPYRVQHPGPMSTQATLAQAVEITGPLRLQVTPGADLFETIESWCVRNQVLTTAFRLLGGVTTELSLMTGKPSDRPDQVATFHGPHVISCPALVLGGHGATGRGENGGVVLHAHVSVLDARASLRGCHVIRGRFIAGNAGITVAIYAVAGGEWVVRQDTETGFNVFFPEIATASGALT